MSIYTQMGYNNRTEYLLELSDSFGIDSDAVFALADILGEGEDFDGLVSTLEDLEYYDM